MSNTNALERPYRFLNTRKKFSNEYTKKLERVWLDLNNSDSPNDHKKHIIIYADPERKKCISFMEFFPEDWEEIDEPVSETMVSKESDNSDEPVLKTASSIEEVNEFVNAPKDPVSVKISPEDRGVSDEELASSVMAMLEEDKPDKAQISNDVPEEITENLEGFEDDFVTLKDTASIPVKEIMQEINESDEKPDEKPKKKKGLFSKLKDTVKTVIDDEDQGPDEISNNKISDNKTSENKISENKTSENKPETKTSDTNKAKPKSKNKETDIYDINLDIDSMFDDLSKANKPKKNNTGEIPTDDINKAAGIQPEPIPEKSAAEAINGFDGYSGFKSHEELASEESFEEQPITDNQTLQGLPIMGTVESELTDEEATIDSEKREDLIPDDSEIPAKDTHVFENELISAGTFANESDEEFDITEDDISEDDISEDTISDDELIDEDEFLVKEESEDDTSPDDTDDNTADVSLSDLLEPTNAPVTDSAKEDGIAALKKKLFEQLKDKLEGDSTENNSSEEETINIKADYKRLNNLPEDEASENIQEDIPLVRSEDKSNNKEIFLQSDVFESSDKPVFDFNKDYGLKELTPESIDSDTESDTDSDTKESPFISIRDITKTTNNINHLTKKLKSNLNNKENNNMNETLIKYIITEIEMQIDELRKNCNDQAIADYISSAMKTKLDTIKEYIS